MKTEVSPSGHITTNGIGIGTVSPEMVRQRASELAVINGRAINDAWPSDLDQAQRELTGAGPDDEPTDIISTEPEADAWNPVPGSVGHQVPDGSATDEEEWQVDSVRLVEEGIAEAEHDQMVRAMEQKTRDNTE